jgi:hypothetical protein
MKKTSVVLILALSILISACENHNVQIEKGNFSRIETANEFALSYLPNYFPELGYKFSAINKICVIESVTNYPDVIEHQMNFTKLASYYEVDGYSGRIEHTEVNDQELLFDNTVRPNGYYDTWSESKSIGTNKQATVKFIMESETIVDSITTPKSFNPVSFSSDTLKGKNDITLNWSQSNEKDDFVIITPSYEYYNHYNKLSIKNGDRIVVLDRGSYTFTKEYFENDLEVPNVNGKLVINLLRVSTKIQDFSNYTKKSAIIATVSKYAYVNTLIKKQ